MEGRPDRPCPGAGRLALSDSGATGSETTTSGAPRASARRESAPAAAAACGAATGRPPRSARDHRAMQSDGCGRCSDASLMVTAQPCSRARSATPPRGSTPWPARRVACSATMSAPSPQSACTTSPPGGCATDGPSTGPTQASELTGRHEPGRAVHRDVLGGEPGLERGDPRRAGSGTPRRHAPSPPRAPSSPLPAPGARPHPEAASAALPALPVAALGRHRVGQGRGAGMVRAVAISEVRERRQEVPCVAPLRRQPSEGVAQCRAARASSAAETRWSGSSASSHAGWRRRCGTAIDATGASSRSKFHGVAKFLPEMDR